MAKSSKTYVCQSCGSVTPRWAGKCEACNEWNTIVEEVVEAAAPKSIGIKKGNRIQVTPLAETQQDRLTRYSSGISELDRVTGGGFVPGSALLIGGDPGIGKSTLLLQAACKMAYAGRKCLYISGEESAGQVRLRAERLGVGSAPLDLAANSNIRDILSTLDSDPPDLVIIDSIQTMYVDNVDSAPGTVTQVRLSALELIRLCKRKNIILMLVGHVTKDGQIAGPRVLEHMVDAVLYFEGDRGHHFRILRGVKNRFGPTDEIGVFEMAGEGLVEVPNPSALFLAERQTDMPGTAVFAGMEGSRPLLVEIQALVSPTSYATPRRAVVGWDAGRLAMLVAVLETRCGVPLSGNDIFLNVAGGIRINEPAADLAVAAALLSVHFNAPLPDSAVFLGEVGLTGEVRPCPQMPLRLKEASKLGFDEAYSPKFKGGTAEGIALRQTRHISDLVALCQERRQGGVRVVAG